MAEEAGFHFADIRVTLERQLGEAPHPADTLPNSIRPSRPDDVPALRAIARVSHRDSRFYYDKHFSRERCEALYETWIEKSVNGYAEVVLVAELQDKPAGYISCHLSSSGAAQIGLFAVEQTAQGHGLGKQLVFEALRWFTQHGASYVTVVTQGRNSRAQRLYQKCGFVTRLVELWYHYWPIPSNPSGA